MKYADALKKVSKAKDSYRGYRLPGREGRTRLVKRENGIAIKYTATDVVTIHPDDSITLDSGGWNSKTTRDRMGYAENVNVFTEGGTMYVCPKGTYPWSALWPEARKHKDQPKVVWEFKDGMTFNAKGTRCLNQFQLGVRSWNTVDWAKHIRAERNRRARERRAEKKIQAEREAQYQAERAKRETARLEREAEESVVSSETKAIENTGLQWPTLIRGAK